MAEITVESPVPQSDPGRRAIEDAIRDTLKDYAGVWLVGIRPARTEPWWVVRMERTDGDFRNTLVVDLRDQDPETLRQSLRDSLKGAA
jgi:hypothetical protein